MNQALKKNIEIYSILCIIEEGEICIVHVYASIYDARQAKTTRIAFDVVIGR